MIQCDLAHLGQEQDKSLCLLVRLSLAQQHLQAVWRFLLAFGAIPSAIAFGPILSLHRCLRRVGVASPFVAMGQGLRWRLTESEAFQESKSLEVGAFSSSSSKAERSFFFQQLNHESNKVWLEESNG